MVPMKRSIIASVCLFLLSSALSLHGQVAPSASASEFKLEAGGLGSVSQPDYAGEGIAQTSPNRLYGAGAFVDAKFNRWIVLEGEGRWLKFNQYLGINETTYLAGPRVPIRDFRHFTPYGKFLVGTGMGSFLSGNTLVLAYGGGVDYRINRRFTARGDFEYQQWRVTPTIWPYAASAGICYKIF